MKLKLRNLHQNSIATDIRVRIGAICIYVLRVVGLKVRVKTRVTIYELVRGRI